MEKQNDFNLSLERLFSSEPVNLLKQLFDLNLIIQKSDENKIIAIWHTLNSAEYMLDENNEYGHNQILELKKCAKSRMKMISHSEFSFKRKEKHDFFKSIVGNLD